MRITLVLLLAATAGFAAAPPPGTIQVTKTVWAAGPPTLPKGATMAVLEGDPRKEGIFTMRLKMPAGARIGPHWHPRQERVTVLSGEVRVGFGDTFDPAAMTRFTSGAFYVNPPLAHHFVTFPRETIIQITGEGPWELNEVK
ncbi:MAG: cupin domain-containing protein [Acidobacteriota bacterium]